ncbi:MAG TPA: ATP-binding protein [Burkholderiales bacterium]|nr:ATP-binding protein [Burkholderiales bacterium]
MRPPLRLLLIEESDDDAKLVLDALHAEDFDPQMKRVATAEQMDLALRDGPWDAVLSDYSLPGFGADQALAMLRESGCGTPFIVVSGSVGDETAVELIKAGATDFVAKNNLRRLGPVIERALREIEAERQHSLTVRALWESEARFRAITANLPGVVFQVIFTADDRIKTIYVSEGCKALCGLSAEQMMKQPTRFLDMIVAEDRWRFHRSRLRSCRNYRPQNWEGRIRLPDQEQVKWINLRASARKLPSGETVSEGVISNITHSKQTELELVSSREAMRDLSSHIHRIKEEERKHVAREIHDDLGGTLTAAKIDLLNLVQQLPEGALDLMAKAGSIEVLLDQATDITRRIARRLRPGVLDHGIAAAIEWQARDFGQRVGIHCHFSCSNEDLQLPSETSTTLFRILQETLTNVAKHAQAENVWISLYEEADRVVLNVADDGRGVADSDLHKPGSFGLQNMFERARYFGGDAEIAARPEGGTQVQVWIKGPFQQHIALHALQADLFQ